MEQQEIKTSPAALSSLHIFHPYFWHNSSSIHLDHHILKLTTKTNPILSTITIITVSTPDGDNAASKRRRGGDFDQGAGEFAAQRVAGLNI